MALRSPTAPTSASAFEIRIPTCFACAIEPPLSLPQVSTPVAFQHLWPGSALGNPEKMDFQTFGANSYRIFEFTTGFGEEQLNFIGAEYSRMSICRCLCRKD
ncbi:hypothetical protein AVEN_205587-1 [Araneus ventricosus]|uniref:Uncharacterized protein n=1 Tax=Araneus ventricosus TaxID=182803 RepID=A0A4Y2F9K5_ARAVE|nr:hypothetical protein AVEN_205587-1 [Araneus ventricosus]